MRSIPLILSILFVTNMSFSQNMFWNNYSEINPANSGLENKLDFNNSYQTKFSENINTYPKTFQSNINTRLAEKHGVGLLYSNYQVFTFAQIDRLGVNYNYQFLLENNRKISLGAYFGGRWLNYKGGFYELISNKTISNPEMNFGISYIGEHIYTGISIVQINIDKSALSSYSSLLNVNFRYKFNLTDNFDLFAEVLLTSDNVYYNNRLSVRGVWKNKLMLGFGYARDNKFGGNFTWDIKEKLRIGYSYMYKTSDLDFGSIGSRSTHEFTLGFRFK